MSRLLTLLELINDEGEFQRFSGLVFPTQPCPSRSMYSCIKRIKTKKQISKTQTQVISKTRITKQDAPVTIGELNQCFCNRIKQVVHNRRLSRSLTNFTSGWLICTVTIVSHPVR